MALDLNKLRETLKAQKAEMKQIDKTIKPKPGPNRYRILYGWSEGNEHVYYHSFGQHFLKNAKDEVIAVYQCLNSTYGQTCPVCDSLQRAVRSTMDDETMELLTNAKSGKSILLNVLALDSDTPNTPVILEVTYGTFRLIVDQCEEWEGKPIEPTGNIIIINREGVGLATKYSVSVSPKVTTIPDATYKLLHNLDEYVKQESDERRSKMLGAINGLSGMVALPSTANDRPRVTDQSFVPTVVKSNNVNLSESLEDMLCGLEEAA